VELATFRTWLVEHGAGSMLVSTHGDTKVTARLQYIVRVGALGSHLEARALILGSCAARAKNSV
jgi:hypothetical protein